MHPPMTDGEFDRLIHKRDGTVARDGNRTQSPQNAPAQAQTGKQRAPSEVPASGAVVEPDLSPQVYHAIDSLDIVPNREDIVAIAKLAAAQRYVSVPTEFCWLVENGKQGSELRYRTMVQGMPVWTEDVYQAIRFSRRADAEMFAEEDEDAWRIVEHGFDTAPDIQSDAHANGDTNV